MRSLGHVISHDASPWPDLLDWRARCWRSFFANSGAKAARALNPAARLQLIGRTAGTHLDWKSSKWPVSPGIREFISATQRKVYASALRVAPVPGEDPGAYARRRGRLGAAAAARAGLWADRHRDRAIAWHAHLLRAPPSHSWASGLVGRNGPEWIRARRAERGASALGGATGTRARPGRPHPRWEESVVDAVAALHG